MTEIHELTCWTCKKPLAKNETVNIEHYKDGEVQVITRLHPDCYNEVVKYLEKQNAEWQVNRKDAFQSAARGGPQVPEQAT